MTKRILIIIFACIGTLGVIYTGLWFLVSANIDKNITQLFDDAALQGITIRSNPPVISGFPGAHHINFTGEIEYEGYIVNIPQAVLTGGLLREGSSVSLSLPEGLTIKGTDIADEDIWSMDYIAIEGILSEFMPYELTSYTMTKGQLNITGSGWLSLDDELQPTGKMQANITGALPFLKWLTEKKLIKEKAAIIAKMVLSSLAKDGTIQTSVSLKNRMLFLGPLRILTLPKFHLGPEFYLDKHSPPALHQ